MVYVANVFVADSWCMETWLVLMSVISVELLVRLLGSSVLCTCFSSRSLHVHLYVPARTHVIINSPRRV